MTAPEIVTIDGREFAVGDCVLVSWRPGKWVAATIHDIDPGDKNYPIVVVWSRNCYYPCRVCEVHSIRENFA